MLDKADHSAIVAPRHRVDGFFEVMDGSLSSKGIHAGDQIGFRRDIGELVSGQIYIVCEHEDSKLVARVYVRDAAGERFSTACPTPTSFWRTSEAMIEAVAVAVTRDLWT